MSLIPGRRTAPFVTHPTPLHPDPRPSAKTQQYFNFEYFILMAAFPPKNKDSRFAEIAFSLNIHIDMDNHPTRKIVCVRT